MVGEESESGRIVHANRVSEVGILPMRAAALLALVFVGLSSATGTPGTGCIYGPPAGGEPRQEPAELPASCTEAGNMNGADAFACGDAALRAQDPERAYRFHVRALETLDDRTLAELAFTRAIDDALSLDDLTAAQSLLERRPDLDDGDRRRVVRQRRRARLLARLAFGFLLLFLGCGAWLSARKGRETRPSAKSIQVRTWIIAPAAGALWIGIATGWLAPHFSEGTSPRPFWLFSAAIPVVSLVAIPYARAANTRRFAAPLAAVAVLAAAILVLYTSDRAWLATLLPGRTP